MFETSNQLQLSSWTYITAVFMAYKITTYICTSFKRSHISFFNFSEMKACTPHSFLRTPTMKCAFYYCNRTVVYPGSAGETYSNVSLFLHYLVVISMEQKKKNDERRTPPLMHLLRQLQEKLLPCNGN